MEWCKGMIRLAKATLFRLACSSQQWLDAGRVSESTCLLYICRCQKWGVVSAMVDDAWHTSAWVPQEKPI